MGHYSEYYEEDARKDMQAERDRRNAKGPEYLNNIDKIFKINGYGGAPTRQIEHKIDELKGLILLWMKY